MKMPRFRLAISFAGAIALLASFAVFADPMHKAVRAGDMREVQKLIAANRGMVNIRNELGSTPLHIAAGNSAADIARLLLDKGADLNAKDNNGATPLHIAAFSGHKANVELFLAQGANVHARDNNGKTARDYAEASLSREVSAFLLIKMLSTPTSTARK